MSDDRSMYIAGEWAAPRGGHVIEVENPATEEIIGRFPSSSAGDVADAVHAAREAFGGWSQTPPSDRAVLLHRLAGELERRKTAIAEVITREVGTPIRMSTRIQAQLPITVVSSMADLLEAGPREERIGNSLIVREPVGVVAAVTPWNYPLHQIVCKVAPALAAGATIVVKPSEVAPLVSCLLFEAIADAGFPAGVANLVQGLGPDVGETLVAHPDVDMVSFTGSVTAGARISALAAASIKRVTLELGGKSANVVLDDADLVTAVKVGVANAFLNGGQTCTAWTRLLVPAARLDEALVLAKEYAEAFAPGDPMDLGTRLGPMVSARQRDRVRAFIQAGIDEGATLITGGTETPAGLDRGYYVSPTVFGAVNPDATIAQEEIFGPVLSIIAYRDEDDAAAIANNSRYGLHGSVWSGDTDRAVAFARRLRTGAVDVNGGSYNPLAPFGGFKQSGIGRELGRYGLEEFTEIKSIQL